MRRHLSKLFGNGIHKATLSVVLPDPENLNSTPEASSPSSPLSDEECTQGVMENTPYGCRYCHKAFPRSYMLTRHEQVSCIKTFITNHYLQFQFCYGN